MVYGGMVKFPVFAMTIAACALTAAIGPAQNEKPIHRFDGKTVAPEVVDREARRMMADARVEGLAMAVIDDGKVSFVRSWGRRNVQKGLPLRTDTIMYLSLIHI